MSSPAGHPDRLRVAVVGCGAIAQLQHLPALAASRSARATVLVDRDVERARALARRWGVPRVVADAAEIGGDADAAIVALPNHLHAPVTVDLLRRGLHVLVEKPMAPTVADCDAMIEAAAAAGRALAVGLEFRFFDATATVRELLDASLVGEIESFDLVQGVIPRWPFESDFVLRKETAGGGVLADYGVHVLDQLLCWLDDWKEVGYRDDSRGGVEADAELELTFAGGLAGRVEVSRTRNLRNTCRFVGSGGLLEVGVWDPDPDVTLRLPGREAQLVGRARRGERPTTFADAFLRQLDDFAAAVREGREPRVPGREGRRTIELVEACYARRQPWVMPWDAPPEIGAPPLVEPARAATEARR
jgi:predicted dehydrogenase